jgi:Rrf2 family transcriptional regulator, iron-sulfur cluster assembly transcription factor
MFVTRKADYAVRSAVYLAQQDGRVVNCEQIASAMQVPRSFLAKIMQRLLQAGIVRSVRGVAGGFQLARDPRQVDLLAVIEAIQGISAANACAVDNTVCSLSATCSVHPVWVKLRGVVERELKSQTLWKLAKKNRV